MCNICVAFATISYPLLRCKNTHSAHCKLQVEYRIGNNTLERLPYWIKGERGNIWSRSSADRNLYDGREGRRKPCICVRFWFGLFVLDSQQVPRYNCNDQRWSVSYTWDTLYWHRLTLTHCGRVTHISVGKLTIIGSDNGLSRSRRQAIIWTNAGILLIGPLGTNFSEISSEIHAFSFKKMHLKVSSAKWRLFCLSLNELIPWWIDNSIHYIEWDEITFSFPNFNGADFEVCKWINNFTPHFTGQRDYLSMVRLKLIHVSKRWYTSCFALSWRCKT